jgi:hypothetical protein
LEKLGASYLQVLILSEKRIDGAIFWIGKI